MHVRARPSAVALYGALLAHTLVSAGNYLFAKRALMEIPALPLGLLRFAGASVLLTILLRRGPDHRREAEPGGGRPPAARAWGPAGGGVPGGHPPRGHPGSGGGRA